MMKKSLTLRFHSQSQADRMASQQYKWLGWRQVPALVARPVEGDGSGRGSPA